MKACDHLWKADALEDGTLAASEAPSFERHARICQECSDRIRQGARLGELAQRLPAVDPGELPLRRLRERILGDARAGALRQRSSSKREWLAGAFAVAAAFFVVAYFVGHRERARARDDSFAGFVTPAPGARWSQARAAGVETVALAGGELLLVVRKQASGERFLVDTPDGELEVRGTTFDVLVDAGSTRHVHVVEGLVVVHLRGRPAMELAAGQAWDLVPETTAAPAPSVAAASPAATSQTSPVIPTVASVALARAPAPAPPRAASATSAESADYEAAMGLYRGARYAEAAAGFRRFALLYRDSSLTEDATFLEALSLTKAGNVDAGSVAAWRHLTQFPGSFHRKEASILVARAARDRGDCKEARRALAAWAASGDAATREALGACAEP